MSGWLSGLKSGWNDDLMSVLLIGWVSGRMNEWKGKLIEEWMSR
jgi:hypothetical protein